MVDAEEVVVELANGYSLRSGCHEDGVIDAGDYVRLCAPNGTERLRWDSDEWQRAPVTVMSAIMVMAAATGKGEEWDVDEV